MPTVRLRVLVLVVLALVVSACSPGQSIPPTTQTGPALTSPVTGPVLLSADGRTITTDAQVECGHDPSLRARSYPNRVTLALVAPLVAQPNEFCLFDFGQEVLSVQTKLPAPLGRRKLVQASSGNAISYFDARLLARLTVLPPGCVLGGDSPSGGFGAGSYVAAARWCPYTKPAFPLATLTVTQAIGHGAFDAKLGSPVVAHPSVNRHRASLQVAAASGPLGVFLRVLTWDADGYTFMLMTSLNGPRERVLTTRQLLAIADGLRP